MELIEDLALHRQMQITISFCLAQVLCPGISPISFWVAHELCPDSWHAAVAELPTMSMSSRYWYWHIARHLAHTIVWNYQATLHSTFPALWDKYFPGLPKKLAQP